MEFTGADLTEICQTACKLAIREEIERDMERNRMREEADMSDDDEESDSMPEILSRHFEVAVRQARRSVSDRDLTQYASFAKLYNNLGQLFLVLPAEVWLLLRFLINPIQVQQEQWKKMMKKIYIVDFLCLII